MDFNEVMLTSPPELAHCAHCSHCYSHCLIDFCGVGGGLVVGGGA